MKLLDSRARYTQVTSRYVVEINDKVYHVTRKVEDYTVEDKIYCEYYKNWRQDVTNDPSHPTQEILDFIDSQEQPVVFDDL